MGGWPTHPHHFGPASQNPGVDASASTRLIKQIREWYRPLKSAIITPSFHRSFDDERLVSVTAFIPLGGWEWWQSWWWVARPSVISLTPWPLEPCWLHALYIIRLKPLSRQTKPMGEGASPAGVCAAASNLRRKQCASKSRR